jgi:hypothetical protein
MSIDLFKLNEKYPFLSIGKSGDQEIVGIIQNSSKYIIAIYDYNAIPSNKLRNLFLTYGHEYWWNSNRKIPIDIFLRGEFDVFKPYIRSYNPKEFTIIHGPELKISNISTKRVKRKQITLIKKVV